MKGILVIDIDETDIYRLCDVFVENGFGTTLYNQRVKLKPIPQLKGIDDYHDFYDLAFSSGWNSCISEILDKSEYELMVKEKIGEEE